jgi:hypothetical protein
LPPMGSLACFAAVPAVIAQWASACTREVLGGALSAFTVAPVEGPFTLGRLPGPVPINTFDGKDVVPVADVVPGLAPVVTFVVEQAARGGSPGWEGGRWSISEATADAFL